MDLLYASNISIFNGYSDHSAVGSLFGRGGETGGGEKCSKMCVNINGKDRIIRRMWR